MGFARVVKAGFGVAIAGVAVWAFRPPEGVDEEGGGTVFGVGDPNARFQIEVFPGTNYMPGTIPGGLGEPLTGYRDVARDFVERFPDTAIVFRNVPANDREWLVTQASAGTAPDLVQVNVEDVWIDTHKGWWLALDDYLDRPNPFVPEGEPGSGQWWDQFKYQAISRGKAGPDGKMYCLTLDMVETGIYYNKTKFAELRLAPPQTWAEFLALQQKIEEAGYIPLQTVIDNVADWGVDLMIDQMYDPILPGVDLAKDPVREQYLEGYLDWDEIALLYGKGFFRPGDPRYREVFRLLKDWRRYWNRDLYHRQTDRMRTFVQQKALMTWDGSWLVHRFAMDKTLGFEWGVYYLPPITRENSRFAAGAPMCVIGGAGSQFSVSARAFGDTGDPATSERLKRVIAFLQFICMPKNAERIVNESLLFVPNIVGGEARPQMQPFVEILKRRYTTTKFRYTFDLRFTDLLTRSLILFLNDGCTEDEFLSLMDRSLGQAIDNAVHRKKPDMEKLERQWAKLAPARAGIEGLPDGGQ